MPWQNIVAAFGLVFLTAIVLPAALMAWARRCPDRLFDEVPSATRPADEIPVFHATAYADERPRNHG